MSGEPRAVVTGGAGFVGSHLVDRLLAEGYEVHAVDDLSGGSLANLASARREGAGRFSFQQLDVRSSALGEFLLRVRPAVVFHLAGTVSIPASIEDPLADADINVMGTVRLLGACCAAEVSKVVYASSAAIYGEAEAIPATEACPQNPLSPHATAKSAVGRYLADFRRLRDLEYTALALANVYGPRQRPPAVVAAFASALSASQPCSLHGGGRQTRDFLFVDDAVDALARAATRGSGLLLNVGTGRETSVAQLHAEMCRLGGAEPLVATTPARAGEPERSSLDPSRAAIHLGWKPWTDLPTGLAAVLG